MKYGTSLRVRHLVGRCEKGEEFIDALGRLCARERVRSGTFQAIGVFSSVELQEFVLDKLCRALLPGGFLILGEAESLSGEVGRGMTAVDGRSRIFRRHL